MRIITAAALLVAATALPAAAADKTDWQAARPAGRPVRCVQTIQIRETRVRSDQVIDFYLRNGTVLRNTLPQPCQQLGFERRFGYRTNIGQLCSVDIITVLRLPPVGAGPSCGLGTFQPVTGAPR